MGLAFVDQIALARNQSCHLPERKILHLPRWHGASEQTGKEIQRREEFVTGQLRSPGNMDRGCRDEEGIQEQWKWAGIGKTEKSEERKAHAREKPV